MNYITTTQLRTMSSELISMLLAGEQVNLVHRSKIVGVIEPKEENSKTLSSKDVDDMYLAISKLKLPKTTRKEREKNYRTHILKKYG